MKALPAVFVSHGAPTLAIEPGLIGPRLGAFTRGLPRPRAERAHPTEDHLLPLFLVLGAAGGDRTDFHCIDGGITHGVLAMDAYVFGDAGTGADAFKAAESQHAGAAI